MQRLNIFKVKNVIAVETAGLDVPPVSPAKLLKGGIVVIELSLPYTSRWGWVSKNGATTFPNRLGVVTHGSSA